MTQSGVPTMTTSGASTVTSGASTAVTSSQPPSTSTIDGNSIPPLSEITSGMPAQGTVTPFTTFTAGATPPVSGAPPLPSRPSEFQLNHKHSLTGNFFHQLL